MTLEEGRLKEAFFVGGVASGIVRGWRYYLIFIFITPDPSSLVGVSMAAATTGRRSQRTHLPILRVSSNIVVASFKKEPPLGGSL